MNQEILLSVTKIIQETLDLPDLKVTELTSAHDVEEWDSLTHLQMISAIEKKFKVKFALVELQDLQNVGDMIQLIMSKVNH